VLLIVPLQSAHAVAIVHAEPLQSGGQALGAVGDEPEARAARLRARPGDDLAIAVDLASVAKDVLESSAENPSWCSARRFLP